MGKQVGCPVVFRPSSLCHHTAVNRGSDMELAVVSSTGSTSETKSTPARRIPQKGRFGLFLCLSNSAVWRHASGLSVFQLIVRAIKSAGNYTIEAHAADDSSPVLQCRLPAKFRNLCWVQVQRSITAL